MENGQNNPANVVLPNLFQKLPKRSLSSFYISEFEALGSLNLQVLICGFLLYLVY